MSVEFDFVAALHVLMISRDPSSHGMRSADAFDNPFLMGVRHCSGVHVQNYDTFHKIINLVLAVAGFMKHGITTAHSTRLYRTARPVADYL